MSNNSNRSEQEELDNQPETKKDEDGEKKEEVV